MVIPGHKIRELGIIRPFSERTSVEYDFGVSAPRSKVRLSHGVSFAGYDLRLDKVDERMLAYKSGDVPIIHGGAFALASTMEEFVMPDDVIGIVHDKSTLARMGLAVQNTVIEPGWRGFLTLELTNHGDSFIPLYRGMGICQVIFHRLEEPVLEGYNGKYQDQPAKPVEAC